MMARSMYSAHASQVGSPRLANTLADIGTPNTADRLADTGPPQPKQNPLIAAPVAPVMIRLRLSTNRYLTEPSVMDTLRSWWLQ